MGRRWERERRDDAVMGVDRALGKVVCDGLSLL
jgi:hypothetical protein